jgi:hypothetical protein
MMGSAVGWGVEKRIESNDDDVEGTVIDDWYVAGGQEKACVMSSHIMAAEANRTRR